MEPNAAKIQTAQVANKVTQQEIEELLDSAETEEHVFHGKELVVSYRFPTRAGFTVSGRAACVDPANFDLEVGRKIARAKVADQLWLLEGYRKQLELAAISETKAHH